MACIPCQKNREMLNLALAKKQQELSRQQIVNRQNVTVPNMTLNNVTYAFEIDENNVSCKGIDMQGKMLSYLCNSTIRVRCGNFAILEIDNNNIFSWRRNCEKQSIDFSQIRGKIIVFITVLKNDN